MCDTSYVEDIPNNLTLYGIKGILDGKIQTFFLQILEIVRLPKTTNNHDKFRVTISDGHYKHRILFAYEAGSKILQGYSFL